MKKFSLFIAVMVMASMGIYAQSYKTIPKPVMDWYLDAAQMFAALEKDLAAATDAPSAANAFDNASTTAEKKDIANRYKKLKKDYPDLVDSSAKPTEGWVPPADWVKTQSDYSKSMKNFGAGMQSVMMKYGQDPAVQASLMRFSKVMESIGDKGGRPHHAS